LCASAFEIRIAHASPDAPAVDVLVDNQVATRFTNVQYKDVTRYIHLPPGQYNFKVVPTGKKTPVILNINQTINELLTPYTFVISGKLASVKPLIFNDDKQRPRRGHSALRFGHLAPDAQACDVRFSGQTKRIITNIGYGQASDYIDVSHGDYTIQILAAGTNNVLLESPLRLLADVPSTFWVEGAGTNLAGVTSRDL